MDVPFQRFAMGFSTVDTLFLLSEWKKNTNIVSICSLIFFYAKRKQSRFHIVFSCVWLFSGDNAVSHLKHGMKLSVSAESGVVGIDVLIST